MGKGIPDRWLKYKPIGQRIEGTRFIAFKVPLRKHISDDVDVKDRLDKEILMEQIPNLGIIIDLTNTKRYYSPSFFVAKGVEHKKLMIPGHHTPPKHLVNLFKIIVINFLNFNCDNDKLIGVHCTHGVNRSGYMICNYMISEMCMKPDEAIAKFSNARGHRIERTNYLDSLKKLANPTAEQKEGSHIQRNSEKHKNNRINNINTDNSTKDAICTSKTSKTPERIVNNARPESAGASHIRNQNNYQRRSTDSRRRRSKDSQHDKYADARNHDQRNNIYRENDRQQQRQYPFNQHINHHHHNHNYHERKFVQERSNSCDNVRHTADYRQNRVEQQRSQRKTVQYESNSSQRHVDRRRTQRECRSSQYEYNHVVNNNEQRFYNNNNKNPGSHNSSRQYRNASSAQTYNRNNTQSRHRDRDDRQTATFWQSKEERQRHASNWRFRSNQHVPNDRM